MFDTGAVTAISPRMVEELNLETLGKKEVFDISTTSRVLDFVKIDTIHFNSINFLNTIAVVLDIETVKDFKCLKIDGFLGANFMMNSIWEIDMVKQEITFTNTIDSITIPENAPYSKIFIGYDGTPAITSFLGKEKLYSTIIDYGYGGGISLFSYDFKNLLSKNPEIKYIKNNGSNLAGVYGDIKTSKSYKAIVDNFKTGKFEAPNTLISFGEIESRVIGAGFLKNYKVVLSWKHRKAWFIDNVKPEEKITVKANGFRFRLEEQSVFISSIYENSEAEQKGLKIDDKILSINDFDYTNVTDEKWCEILATNHSDKQQITIETNGEERTVLVERQVLLSN